MYASQKYYMNVYKGAAGEGKAKELLAVASMLIDALTYNRIKAVGFKNLTDFQKASVKKACCLIADHMERSGTDIGAYVDSFSLQDMRINMRKRKARPWEAVGCGLWAWLTLTQTGLMRGNLL